MPSSKRRPSFFWSDGLGQPAPGPAIGEAVATEIIGTGAATIPDGFRISRF
jgi:hypothetical protein